jgi:spoIIIJ-associated protein
MTGEISVEATGETVGEAKWAAIRELEQLVPGVDRESIRLQVVSEGERGLLGVGFTPARVVASVAGAAAAAVDDTEPGTPQAEAVRELLELAIRAIGTSARIRVDEDEDAITATLTGADTGVLIGRHGQTIDALQYLANAISHRIEGEARRRVTVDAGGYRARRTATVEAIARRSAERASATGQSVALEPMTAVERKIVHESLKDDPEVETASEGTEPHRYVVVVPRHAAV